MKKPFLKFNVGLSNSYQTIKEEAEKIELAIENGVEYVSQISVEKTRLLDMWKLVSSYKTEKTKFASVPLYESVLLNEPLVETIERQYNSGVRHFVLDFVPRYLIEQANLDKNFRINSRTGYFLTEYFKKNPNKNENPCIEIIDWVKKFQKQNKDIQFVFNTVLRPGNCANYGIKYLLEEIKYYEKNNFLSKDAILEIGGHIRVNNFKTVINALGDTKISLMGPLITDTTNKYDHITNIIGQNIFASMYKNVVGLLVISPSEHLHLPTLEDDKEAIIHARLCQHQIGLLYEDEECLKVEDEFNKKTIACNIKKNLFGDIKGLKPCDMCGDFCPLRKIKK
ncbi:MAG TPA: phosphomethylpyrimidine synthase ThiC [Rickettsiales bacterium]|nr:phosphomethylpyrimidine synthase ThiC [Rickettsiales bacterium]